MSNDTRTLPSPPVNGGSWIAVIDVEDEINAGKPMPIDLTDAEIERIRLEEKCRFVIREELAEHSSSSASRAWKFLNSAFTLWLLSAVVVSAGGTIYAKWSEARAAERRRIATCEALDLEIGYRFSHALLSLYRVQLTYDEGLGSNDKSPAEVLLEQKRGTIEAVHRLYYAPADSFPPLYPEYAKFGLPALVTELRRNQHDPAARDELTAVLRNITVDSTDETIELPTANWTERIISKYVLPRWTKDFEVKDPFGP